MSDFDRFFGSSGFSQVTLPNLRLRSQLKEQVICYYLHKRLRPKFRRKHVMVIQNVTTALPSLILRVQ